MMVGQLERQRAGEFCREENDGKPKDDASNRSAWPLE
jgi:hypothetical protein